MSKRSNSTGIDQEKFTIVVKKTALLNAFLNCSSSFELDLFCRHIHTCSFFASF